MTDDNFDDYVDDGDGIGESVGDDADIEVGGSAEADSEADSDVEAEAATREPSTWTRPEATGVTSVDAALDELTRLDELPTSEHVAVYEGLHRQLQDALADLDGA